MFGLPTKHSCLASLNGEFEVLEIEIVHLTGFDIESHIDKVDLFEVFLNFYDLLAIVEAREQIYKAVPKSSSFSKL